MARLGLQHDRLADRRPVARVRRLARPSPRAARSARQPSKAGEIPATVASDANREARLAAALSVPPTDATLTTGYSHACAVDRSDAIQCWGDNASGQLGDGTTTRRLTPVSVIGLSGKVASVVGGAAHTCALLQSRRRAVLGAEHGRPAR